MDAKWTGHVFVAGRTGTGKSHWAMQYCQAWAGPVLVVDRKLGMARDLGWPAADRRDLDRDIVDACRRGVCYVPHWDPKVARAEVDLLLQLIFRAGPYDPAYLVVVDEAWRVAREGERPGQVHRVAVEGRASGIQLLAISQRPADVSKDVVTQCSTIVIFDTSFEGPWMARYGIDHAEVTRLLEIGGQYSYVTWDGKQLYGPDRAPARV